MRVLAVPLLLLLAACSSEFEPTVTRHVVVMPEESMFSCNTVERFPDHRSLTDLQVARLLVELHQNNVQCKNSMTTIRQFLENARSRIEAGN